MPCLNGPYHCTAKRTATRLDPVNDRFKCVSNGCINLQATVKICARAAGNGDSVPAEPEELLPEATPGDFIPRLRWIKPDGLTIWTSKRLTF